MLVEIRFFDFDENVDDKGSVVDGIGVQRALQLVMSAVIPRGS